MAEPANPSKARAKLWTPQTPNNPVQTLRIPSVTSRKVRSNLSVTTRKVSLRSFCDLFGIIGSEDGHTNDDYGLWIRGDISPLFGDIDYDYGDWLGGDISTLV